MDTRLKSKMPRTLPGVDNVIRELYNRAGGSSSRSPSPPVRSRSGSPSASRSSSAPPSGGAYRTLPVQIPQNLAFNMSRVPTRHAYAQTDFSPQRPRSRSPSPGRRRGRPKRRGGGGGGGGGSPSSSPHGSRSNSPVRGARRGGRGRRASPNVNNRRRIKNPFLKRVSGSDNVLVYQGERGRGERRRKNPVKFIKRDGNFRHRKLDNKVCSHLLSHCSERHPLVRDQVERETIIEFEERR